MPRSGEASAEIIEQAPPPPEVEQKKTSTALVRVDDSDSAGGMSIAEVQVAMAEHGITEAVTGLKPKTLKVLRTTCTEHAVTRDAIEAAWADAQAWSAEQGHRGVYAMTLCRALDGEMRRRAQGQGAEVSGEARAPPRAAQSPQRVFLTAKEQATRRGMSGGLNLLRTMAPACSGAPDGDDEQ